MNAIFRSIKHISGGLMAAALLLSGCKPQQITAGQGVTASIDPENNSVSIIVTATLPVQTESQPIIVTATPPVSNSNTPIIVTATLQASSGTTSLATVEPGIGGNFDCNEIKDDPAAYAISQYTGDRINLERWTDIGGVSGKLGQYSVELDTRGNNPSNNILDEIHGLLICFDSMANAAITFDQQILNNQTEQLADDSVLTEGWGKDPNKYVIWIQRGNIVMQIKGLRDGSAKDNLVIQETRSQAMQALQNASTLALVSAD